MQDNHRKMRMLRCVNHTKTNKIKIDHIHKKVQARTKIKLENAT